MKPTTSLLLTAIAMAMAFAAGGALAEPVEGLAGPSALPAEKTGAPDRTPAGLPEPDSFYATVFDASVVFAGIARVCDDPNAVELGKRNVRRLLEFGLKTNAITQRGRAVLRYPDRMIRLFELKYALNKMNSALTCEQTSHMISKIDRVIDGFYVN